ncbi:Variant-specific surface protein, partial [Giardia duodenalis]
VLGDSAWWTLLLAPAAGSAPVLCGAVPARGGCYDARAAPGSGVCREARDGTCVGYAEEISRQGKSLKAIDRQTSETCTSGTAATNCKEGACNVQIGSETYCSQCNAGAEYLVNGKCKSTAEQSGCTQQTVPNGTCKSCGDGYFLHKGGCYEIANPPGSTICGQKGVAGVCQTCKDGYFKNLEPAATKQSCIACNETANIDGVTGVVGCTTCSSPSAAGDSNTPKTATCTACGDSKIVKTDKDKTTTCVTEEECTKAEGFFIDNTGGKKCSACNENCRTCSGGATNDKCTSCKTDTLYLKKADGLQTGTCVNAAGCTNGNTYYADDTVDPTSGKLCRKCAEGGVTVCTKCEKIESGVVCKECTGETAIFGLNKKSCVSQCPVNSQAGSDSVCTCNDGFTPNEDSTACVAASSCKTPHCQTCTGEGQENETCTACATGYYLTPTGQCVDSCDKLGGYYADGNVCKPCSPECASCSTAGNNKCLSCPAGKALKYTSETKVDQGGSCVDECRANTGGCTDCAAVIGGSKYCSRCSDTNQAPLNGNCAANTARTKFCTTVKDGACTQCANGYFLLDGGCYQTSRQPGSQMCTQADATGRCTNCANGQNPNSSGVCPECPAGCSKCSDANTCTECLAGYYKSGTSCVKCSENSNNIQGVPNCVSCKEPSSGSGTVTCYVTQTPTVDPTDPSVNKGGLSSGAIAGISIAVIAVVGGLVGFLCWWFVCYR